MRAHNLTGQRFGRLLVVARAGSSDRGAAIWTCQCECGQTHYVRGQSLRRGAIRSCGCLNRDLLRARMTKHGGHSLPEYRIWSGAKRRCFHPGTPYYKYYGGRGITMCDRWRHSFVSFYEDMGPRPSPTLTLERIDNNGPYEPGNCCWATRRQQRRNQRPRSSVTFRGATHTIWEWAHLFNLPPRTLWDRLKRYHWPVQRALTTPLTVATPPHV